MRHLPFRLSHSMSQSCLTRIFLSTSVLSHRHLCDRVNRAWGMGKESDVDFLSLCCWLRDQ